MLGFSLFVIDLILYKFSVVPAYYREIYQDKELNKDGWMKGQCKNVIKEREE